MYILILIIITMQRNTFHNLFNFYVIYRHKYLTIFIVTKHQHHHYFHTKWVRKFSHYSRAGHGCLTFLAWPLFTSLFGKFASFENSVPILALFFDIVPKRLFPMLYEREGEEVKQEITQRNRKRSRKNKFCDSRWEKCLFWFLCHIFRLSVPI